MPPASRQKAKIISGDSIKVSMVKLAGQRFLRAIIGMSHEIGIQSSMIAETEYINSNRTPSTDTD